MPFAFRHLPVGDIRATQNFEQLQTQLNTLEAQLAALMARPVPAETRFLQLAVPAGHRLAFGTANFKFGAGKSHATTQLSIATGLVSITKAWFQPNLTLAASVSVETLEAGTIKAKLYTPLNEFETPAEVEAEWFAIE